MFLFPPPFSALGDLHGLVFIKRAGGCGGGRAGLFIAAGIIRAAFVLPAGLPPSPPARPGWSAASPAAAGRSRHVERQEKTCLSLPGLALPQSAEGRGGGKRKKNKIKQTQTTPNPPFPCSGRDAERREAGGESPPRHRPALRRTRRRREGEAMMAAALTQHGARPGAPCPPFPPPGTRCCRSLFT